TAHPDPKRRIEAIETLHTVHPRTRAWLGRLIALVDDDDAEVRCTVLSVIGWWHDQRFATSAVPRLKKALEDPNASVRIAAAHALAWLNLELPAATKALRAGMRDPDAQVRQQAVGAVVETIGKELFVEIANCVRSDPDEDVQSIAVRELRH